MENTIALKNENIDLPQGDLRAFCVRWKIHELALFGSALRDDFGPDSDLDFLVSFVPGSHWTLLDRVQMEEELRNLLNRPVDLVSRRAIEQSRNPIRRKAILDTAQVLYVT